MLRSQYVLPIRFSILSTTDRRVFARSPPPTDGAADSRQNVRRFPCYRETPRLTDRAGRPEGEQFSKKILNQLTARAVPIIIIPAGLVGSPRLNAIYSAMRRTRQLISLAVLALYAAQVLGGQVLHFLQCSSDAALCCELRCCDLGLSDRHCVLDGDLHDHYHGDADHESSSGTGAPRKPHESSNCWVCQVLGQAQDQAPSVELVASERLPSSPQPLVAEYYPTLGHSGFHSRAPPAV